MKNFKHVEIAKSKNGKRYYYFRKDKALARIALADPIDEDNPSEDFKRSYDSATRMYRAKLVTIPELSEDEQMQILNGNIYIVRYRAWVKIGFSIHPKKRLSSLQTAMPQRGELLVSFPGTRKLEQELHKRFCRYREVGEWFRCEGAVERWVNSKLQLGANPEKLSVSG